MNRLDRHDRIHPSAPRLDEIQGNRIFPEVAKGSQIGDVEGPFIAVIKITVGAADMIAVVNKIAAVLTAESKELPGFLAAEILGSVDNKTIVILTEWCDHHAWAQSRYDARVGEMIGSLYINSATIEFETYTRQGTFQKT